MVSLPHRFASLKNTLFKINYSASHITFLVNHIAINKMHPLHITQRRRQTERKKEGLWWHTTSGLEVSKSACVRTWSRRRLAQAFVEGLRERGYDETGKLVDASKIQNDHVARLIRSGRSVDLSGSLRMHEMPAIVPAKYKAVKEEVGCVLDAMVQAAIDAALDLGSKNGEKMGRKPRAEPRATGLAGLWQEFAMPSKSNRASRVRSRPELAQAKSRPELAQAKSRPKPAHAAPRTQRNPARGMAGS